MSNPSGKKAPLAIIPSSERAGRPSQKCPFFRRILSKLNKNMRKSNGSFLPSDRSEETMKYWPLYVRGRFRHRKHRTPPLLRQTGYREGRRIKNDTGTNRGTNYLQLPNPDNHQRIG